MNSGSSSAAPSMVQSAHLTCRCGKHMGSSHRLCKRGSALRCSDFRPPRTCKTIFPVEKWDQVIAIDLSSAFHTTRLAVPAMRKTGWGRIVNVASAHGLVASPFKAAYVAAKHGIVGLTKVTALETAKENITCNAICPGYVWTPLVEAQIEDQAKSHGIPREQVIRDVLLAQQPNKR